MIDEQALDEACIAKIANGATADVWRQHWAWIVANAPSDAKDIRDGVRTVVEAYLAALPNDEAAFTAALSQHVFNTRELQRLNDREADRWKLRPGEREEAFARWEASEQDVWLLYRQAKGGA